MAERRDPKLVGRWFVVNEEGGPWTFVDKDVWDRSGASIRGERLEGGVMRIEDSIINKIRTPTISDRELLDAGYMLPAWQCSSCANSAVLKPRFCPECGAKTGIE
jgi:hypothetical protein